MPIGEVYDAIVLGGGPAGAFTAYNLSKADLKVLLLEKEKLPRFKLCAGCISARTLGLLPDGYQRLILNTISSGRLGFAGIEEYRLEAKEEIAYIVDRRSFDHFLVEKALEAGASLLEAEFLGFEKEKACYRVYTSKSSFLSDFIIGADGFYSKVSKLLGYKKRKFFRSLELFTEGELKNEVLIEIGLVSRGYVWVFPHGEGISLGVASTGRENLLKILREYAQLRGIKFQPPKGWHIPFIEKEGDLHTGRDRVLLVGDAANMTDPLLGEGIYYALQGGKILAQAVLEKPADSVKAYRSKLKPILQELTYAGRIAWLAYSFQTIAYKMGKDFALRSFYGLLKGERSYKELYWRGLPSFLKYLTIKRLRGIIKPNEESIGGSISKYGHINGKY